MKKVLLLIFDTHVSEEVINTCSEMLQCLEPLVTILSPVDRHTVARIASNEGLKDTEVRERLLHEAYINLYHLEDVFGKTGQQVTIAAKDMRLPEDLLLEIRKTNPAMLIIVGKIDYFILESLHGSVCVPMLLLPSED